MTATVKGLRRQYADRRPWVTAFCVEGDYYIGLGDWRICPQLTFERSECDRLRRTLKRALRRKDRPAKNHPYGGLRISVDLSLGFLRFSGEQFGVDTEFRLNRCRCRELIGVLAPANLDRLERKYEEEVKELRED